ncbi:MAG: 16S rRNA (cytidine(1402)-2'-O)-methyltransferase [Bacteroidales bacterium]|jgi:16S rRNA (cytidine1402-2'-O)-methyltransferase|nr:16S rRNA (cytidine(1402)-2'-O)-methyltransferase [Bacteroidales bacterium]
MTKLYLVPTPIGNLEDITLRAIRILKEADLILAEDTRTSKTLLTHYDINTPVVAHHQFNEHQTLTNIINQLLSGKTIALITDAGTPAISDPGFLLTRECIRNGIEVECLAGATAFVPALVCSGFPCDRFCFEGFLPHKKGRQSRLEILKDETRTIIFYESPHRLLKTLTDLAATFGQDRLCCVCREISKKFEQIKRDTIQNLLQYYTDNQIKGEIVILVSAVA